MNAPRGVTVALIYTRVSSDEQAREGLSLDAQLAESRRYAARQGWVLGPEHQDVMTGKRDDRPAYQTLLADVRRLRAEGTPAVVVVAALDRFGRRLLERVRCREELKAMGVPVHSVREGGEVSDLVANVLAAVAEEETRRLGERVRATNEHLRSLGWRPQGRAPWLYRVRPATPEERAAGAPRSVLEVDPVTAPYVQEAFQRLADGASLRSVIRWIASLPDAARGDRAMTLYAVQGMFRAAVYVGRVGGRTKSDKLALPRGRWPALVGDEVWRRVQDRIASHQRVPHQASNRHLLTGFLRCPLCGERMHGQTIRGKRRYPSARYRCSGYAHGAFAADRRCAYTAHAGRVDAAV